MALPTITVLDFVGWVKIVVNDFKQVDLEQYITLFQEKYLRQIVGDAAYTDIENQTRQKWTDLLNGVNYVDADGNRRYHNGIVPSLVYFIYFEFTRDNFIPTQAGKVKGKSENSDRSMDLEVSNIARSRFNEGVRLINDSMSCFLEANEEFDEEITLSVDNADNTYTLSVDNTKYLEDSDTVTISGTDYSVSNVVQNASFDINAGQTGLDFLGDSAQWEPYKDVVFCEMQTAPI